jgi:hypothetical protein
MHTETNTSGSEVACQLACREELDCHYFTWVRWVLCTGIQVHLEMGNRASGVQGGIGLSLLHLGQV